MKFTRLQSLARRATDGPMRQEEGNKHLCLRLQYNGTFARVLEVQLKLYMYMLKTVITTSWSSGRQPRHC